ncbi:T9SS type A sorting domain-containing protein [Hymenobacter sp. NST-14]|uniref:T9SS type A sorting domain-containing protein n=1 Tax=Hymenobacter piscis TaxID=2839984 RepID=UPI001C017E3B|nr:T9SS type A sorting domain-containing protein [Hymenobacter piscis]MBT9392654.1 T9SS type A sorting domain-containing protein [Hymenobacter piscis]
MKKTYNSPARHRSWLQLLAIWSLLVGLPSLGKAQVFTERMGTTATEGQQVAAYEASLGFDNDSEKGLDYLASGTDTPVLSLVGTGSTSGGPNILFPNSAAAANFFIRSINTAGFSGGSLSFQLNAPAGQFTGTTVAAGNNRFRIGYAIGTVSPVNGAVTYSTYTNVGYTYSAGSTGGWGTATLTLPAAVPGNALVALRFQRIGAATGDFRLDDVQLTSTVTPTITGLPTELDFGDIAVGTFATQTVRVSGQGLTGNLTVTAPAGYLVRNPSGGAFVQTLSLPSNNGVTPSTRIQVRFAPATAGPNNAALVVSSPGTTDVEIDLMGNGTEGTLTANPTSINFGTVFTGQSTLPTDVTVTGTDVAGNVTVTAPTGFQVRKTTTSAYGSSIILTPAEAAAGFTFQVRFNPSTAGSYSVPLLISATNASTSVALQGQANPAPAGPFITVNPSSLDFGTVTSTGSAQTLSFTVNAGNLTAPLVLTGSSDIIRFRDTSAGGTPVTGPITINPVNGTVSTRTIEVELRGPIPSGSFTGTITASSTGATNQVVTITANSTGGNSTLNIQRTLAQFSTVPGVPSAAQFYTVSGTNLLRPITVTAPQYFQVALDSTFTGITTTGNSLVLNQNGSGEVLVTRIYVRFLPPSALSTTTVIVNTSSPAPEQGVRANGTSEPSIQLANTFQPVSLVVLNTPSAFQALTVNAERVLQPITISKRVDPNPLNPGLTPQFELSLDNVTFSDEITLTPNPATFTVNQPIFVRYVPTYLGSANSTLRFQSSDFSNPNPQNFAVNGLLTGSSIDVEPTRRSEATVTRNNSTAIVNFNLPPNFAAQGFGEGRLILASENSTLPANIRPQDGQPYQTGNQTYGIEQFAPGYFVVYSGSNNTVQVDGLVSGTTYYFYTFEYNNIDPSGLQLTGTENYLTPPEPQIIPGIIAPSPLPVTLVAFTARVKGSQVALNWNTAAELNNKHFEVQRSQDGKSFETILTTPGKGTTNSASSYSEVDRRPLSGVSYYRLKQVDLDGTFAYSGIETVNFLSNGELVMYPNPVEEQLTIQVAGSTEGLQVRITDLTGRVISTQALTADGKLNMADLKAGTYLVTVGRGDTSVTRRIVKK